MMNTFIIINIGPIHVSDSLEDKSMFVNFKKTFPLNSLGHSFERRAYCLRVCLKAIQNRVFPTPTQVD